MILGRTCQTGCGTGAGLAAGVASPVRAGVTAWRGQLPSRLSLGTGTGAGHQLPAAATAGCHGMWGTQRDSTLQRNSDERHSTDLMQPLSPSPTAEVGWDTPHPLFLHPAMACP